MSSIFSNHYALRWQNQLQEKKKKKNSKRQKHVGAKQYTTKEPMDL